MPADVFDDKGENHKGKDDEFLFFSGNNWLRIDVMKNCQVSTEWHWGRISFWWKYTSSQQTHTFNFDLWGKNTTKNVLFGEQLWSCHFPFVLKLSVTFLHFLQNKVQKSWAQYSRTVRMDHNLPLQLYLLLYLVDTYGHACAHVCKHAHTNACILVHSRPSTLSFLKYDVFMYLTHAIMPFHHSPMIRSQPHLTSSLNNLSSISSFPRARINLSALTVAMNFL